MRQVGILLVLVLLGLGGYVYWRRQLAPPAVPPVEVDRGVPPGIGGPAPAPPPAPKAEADPLLRRWHAAVIQRNKDEVTSVQAALQAREGEYRERLVRMAREDLDPRVRAFTVTLLGRFKAGPGESFFAERLGDTSEFPRDAALGALERAGTRESLKAVERVAAGDPAEAVRLHAAAVAKTLRAK